MNFGQLQSSVAIEIHDETATFYSAQDIQKSLNEGYMEMSEVSEWNEVTTTVNTASNQIYYDAALLTGTQFLTARACQNPTTKKWLTPVDVLYMDSQVHPRWENIQAEPEYMLMRGPLTIAFAPKRNIDGTLTLFHTALPAQMTTDSDEPGFPQEFHRGLIEYALYDLLSQDQESTKAMRHWLLYQQLEADLTSYVDKRVSIPRIETMNV